MPKYFAFLRAVNVGHRKVIMSELRIQLGGLGFTEVETFIASGNIIFACDDKHVFELEIMIMEMMRQNYGFEVETYIRTPQEISELLKLTPFSANKVQTAHSLHVAFFPSPLTPEVHEKTLDLQNSENDFHFAGNNLLWLNQKSIHDTSLAYAKVESIMSTKMTMRGIKTLERMIAKFPPADG